MKHVAIHIPRNLLIKSTTCRNHCHCRDISKVPLSVFRVFRGYPESTVNRVITTKHTKYTKGGQWKSYIRQRVMQSWGLVSKSIAKWVVASGTTLNVEHRTSNIELRVILRRCSDLLNSTLKVRRSMFDVRKSRSSSTNSQTQELSPADGTRSVPATKTTRSPVCRRWQAGSAGRSGSGRRYRDRSPGP